MTITEIASLIMSLTAFISGIYPVIHTRKKQKPEISKLSADAASVWQAIADKAAVDAMKLAERMDKLESQSRRQQATIEKQNKEIEELRCENEKLRDWAERLVMQLDEHKIPPVSYEASGM